MDSGSTDISCQIIGGPGVNILLLTTNAQHNSLAGHGVVLAKGHGLHKPNAQIAAICLKNSLFCCWSPFADTPTRSRLCLLYKYLIFRDLLDLYLPRLSEQMCEYILYTRLPICLNYVDLFKLSFSRRESSRIVKYI